MALAANLVAPIAGQPSFAEAVPHRVQVAFHAHESADGLVGNFLTAVTHGLTSSGQRELVLTLRLGDLEHPIPKMQEIVRFVTTVYAWATAGNFVDEGGLTQFGDRGLFERPQSGLLYVEARPIPGITLPERALAAIFVDPKESRAAADYGIYRVLTRIGAQLRLFPFPTWGALDRPSAMTSRESESLLTKMFRVPVRGASFVVAEQCLRLTIPSGAKSLTGGVGHLPSTAPFALLVRPADGANAVLVWRPGQREVSGISPDGSDSSRMSGSCILFVPSAEGDQARQFEDGYSILLSPKSWELLVAAVTEKRALSLEMEGSLRFELEWR